MSEKRETSMEVAPQKKFSEGKKNDKNNNKKRNKFDVEDLSEEDRRKKCELESLADKILLPDECQENKKNYIEEIRNDLKNSTNSLASVPKPLKFLQPYFKDFVTFYNELNHEIHPYKRTLADILSIMSTICAPKNSQSMLKYKLEGSNEDISVFNYEYIRSLTFEVGVEYNSRIKNSQPVEEILKLINEIVVYYMGHGAECEAVDLLCEVDKIEKLEDFVDGNSYKRAVSYMLSMSNYTVSYEECEKILKMAYNILLKNGELSDALRVALKLNKLSMIEDVLKGCDDKSLKKQLVLICARQHRFLKIVQDDEELCNLCSGEMMNSHFQYLAKELDVLEPKSTADVYKTYLEEKTGLSRITPMDSERQNLASTFVNAFVNAAFCTDKLVLANEGSSTSWITKTKDPHVLMNMVASLGVVLLWNIDEGINKIDRYQYMEDINTKAGALLGFGLISSNVYNEADTAHALLTEYLDSTDNTIIVSAVLGLGYAYAGSCREDLLECLAPIVVDTTYNLECSVMAALSIGLIYVGSCVKEAAEIILQTIIERQSIEGMDSTLYSFFGVALGLVFLGSRDDCEILLTAMNAVTHPVKNYINCTLEGMSFAFSGDVLKVQHMLQICAENRSNVKPGEGTDSDTTIENGNLCNLDKTTAVINVSLIALGEEIGSEMILRTVDHILQYGDISERKGIPLALALLGMSNPKPVIVDLLSKLSHDSDSDVALNAIISLGLVGAGTNNSRIASLLRQLACYYQKEPNMLFIVRVAQGLLYLGKGLLTLNPAHSDRFLINYVSLGCILIVLHACIRLKSTILGRYSYLLYHLVPAMYPRMLITVDEELKSLPITVRVGQAVDVVGQAGRPKTITGFQTHTTPILLNYGERAELATEEYIPLTSVLEGIVILRKNPSFKTSGISS